MVGCPHGAKNTLVKNYLWFAERARREGDAGAHGGRHPAARRGRRLGRLRGHDRALGRVAAPRPPRADRARGVVVAAGALGHQPAARSVPAQRLAAEHLATASASSCARTREAILAVTLPEGAPRRDARVAITGSIYPDPDTHIETVVYGDAGDAMRLLFTLLVGDGTRSRGR